MIALQTPLSQQQHDWLSHCSQPSFNLREMTLTVNGDGYMPRLQLQHLTNLTSLTLISNRCANQNGDTNLQQGRPEPDLICSASVAGVHTRCCKQVMLRSACRALTPSDRPAPQYPSSLRCLRIESPSIDLCSALRGCEIPAQCAISVAADNALLIPRPSLPQMFGGAHQLQFEARTLKLFCDEQPVSAALARDGPAAALACFFSSIAGLQSVRIQAPVYIAAFPFNNYPVYPDVHSLAAALQRSNRLSCISVEREYAVLDYLGGSV